MNNIVKPFDVKFSLGEKDHRGSLENEMRDGLMRKGFHGNVSDPTKCIIWILGITSRLVHPRFTAVYVTLVIADFFFFSPVYMSYDLLPQVDGSVVEQWYLNRGVPGSKPQSVMC